MEEDKVDLLKYAKTEIIKNRSYGSIGYKSVDENTFRKKVNLGDTIIYKYDNDLGYGIVKAITWRGVNISTNQGDRFFKWCHVLQINKK